MNKIKLFALILAFTSSGCASKQHDTTASTKIILPPVIQYSSEEFAELAKEAENNTCPAHIEFGKDYILTRDKLRVAKDML